jgi:hypothetical protein
MATNAQAKTEPQHPPLARDALGNLVAVPDGTAAWRICRQTTGRPKEIVGPDKRPMRFPLETTGEELADLCGADVYRVYALDDVGRVLDYVVTVDASRDAREVRNAAPDAMAPSVTRTAAPMSDLRFALETMAQMMRVNGEALRAVTESQADWVKSIASARGFFRNAAPPTPAERSAELESGDEDDEDEGDDEEVEEPAAGKTIYDVLVPLAENLAPAAKPFVAMLAGGVGAKVLGGAGTAKGDADLASKPKWELRELYDLNYASEKAKARKAGTATAKPSLQARVMADPKLMAHFMAIKALLTGDEVARVLALGERWSEEVQEELIARVGALSPQEAAEFLREVLVEVSAGVPNQSPASPPA